MKEVGMTTFDGALIGKIWPACRVVTGLRVCKSIREHIQFDSEKVILMWKKRWNTVEGKKIDIGADLALFRHNGVAIHLHARKVNKIGMNWVPISGCENLLETILEGIHKARALGEVETLWGMKQSSR